MKLTIILSSLFLAISMGLWGGFRKPKALWWKIITALILIFGTWLTLYPRVAAELEELEYLGKYIGKKSIPTKVFLTDYVYQIDPVTQKKYVEIYGGSNHEGSPHKLFVDEHNYAILKQSTSWLLNIWVEQANGNLHLAEIVEASPWITYPYILSLDNRIKILNFHVPMAWIAVLSYLISMIYSIKYLRNGDTSNDVAASSSAALGTLFAILATVSGMIWAKFNWGSYWNWDPRETSIFILLLIYFAYFALRAGIEREEFRARSSAVYSIIAFVTVPFLVFVMPRVSTGLHPGAQGDGMSGPILNTSRGMLDSQLMFAYGLCMLGFTLLYFWMLNIVIRTNLLKKRVGE